MEKEYLFIFGYEDVEEKKANDAQGTDFESSAFVRIVASGEQQALEWGREIADHFIARLYGDPTKSWKREGFAAWIEQSPEEHLRQSWETIPVVRVGEYPPQGALEPRA
jgi:hypothetical protein